MGLNADRSRTAVAPATVLPRFLNGLPTRFAVGTGPVVFNAVLIDIDPDRGHAHSIERISRIIEV